MARNTFVAVRRENVADDFFAQKYEYQVGFLDSGHVTLSTTSPIEAKEKARDLAAGRDMPGFLMERDHGVEVWINPDYHGGEVQAPYKVIKDSQTGNWRVVQFGNNQASTTERYKRDAVSRAKHFAKNQGAHGVYIISENGSTEYWVAPDYRRRR